MSDDDLLENIWFQLGAGLASIAAVSYYLFFFTTALGPYGDPADIYHLLILVATLFMVLVLVQIWRKVEDVD